MYVIDQVISEVQLKSKETRLCKYREVYKYIRYQHSIRKRGVEMTNNGYIIVFVKIFAAIVSAIAYTLYSSWKIYTPIAERLPDTDYFSFSGLFAINFAPNFIIFIILGVILSPMIDRFIYKKFGLKGFKGVLTILLAYLLLGVGGGALVSIFFYKMNFVYHYMVVSMCCVLIFLFFQTVFQFFLYRMVKH